MHEPDPALTALSPVDLLTTLLYGEARGESLLAQVAVACSVRNRLTREHASDVRAVALKWAQYSCLWPTLGGKDFEAVHTFARLLSAEGALTPLEEQLRWIAEGVLDGQVMDVTGGATHYFDASISPPFWAAAPAHESLRTGRLSFWAGVA